MKEGIKIAIGCLAALAQVRLTECHEFCSFTLIWCLEILLSITTKHGRLQITLAATACPQNISPDVDPALCDPVSFEQAPDEFFTIIDAGFGKMKIRVCLALPLVRNPILHNLVLWMTLTQHARADSQSVRAWAPRCADRFYNLVKHGFYDNQRFYRVTPAYIQFGYHADRVVNEDIYQYVFARSR